MRNKIFITLGILILSVLCAFTNDVLAVGNVFQSWVNIDNSNNRYMLYRTYIYPAKDAVHTYTYNRNYAGNEPIPGYTYMAYKEDPEDSDEYVQSGNTESKWVYRRDIYQGQETRPNFPDGAGNEKTVGVIFHRNQISTYTNAAAPNLNNYNYKNEVVAYNATTKEITQDFEEIKVAFANSEAKYVTLSNSKGLTSPYFKDNNNIILEQSTSNRPITEDSRAGTGLLMSYDAETETANEVEYRYALIGVYDNSGEFIENIWIKDNIVGGDALNELIAGVKGESRCYVSNVMAGRTTNLNLRENKDNKKTAAFEVAKSAANFFNMYPYNDKEKYAELTGTEENLSKEKGSGYIWNQTAKGILKDTDALGSIVNLYDNVVEFPQWATRKVIVRHINIGDNTTISSRIIDAGTRITPKNPTLQLDNPTSTINSETVPANIDGEEYYTHITVDQGVTKTALEDTNTYRCIGYNVSVANSYDEAKSNLNLTIKANSFKKFTDANRNVYVKAKSITSNDDCIIIDFYYTERDKDVYVNHIYLNKDGIVRALNEQNIKSNETAIMNNVTINNLSTKEFVEERYAKKLGYGVKTKTADSLSKMTDVHYLGYQLLDEKKDISALIGKQVDILANNTSKEVIISGDTVQVNYYYYVEQMIVKSSPNKTIGGKVFAIATGSNQIEGACTDTGTGFSIKSFPTQTNLKLGIENIPKGMISAITTEYENPSKNSGKININLNITHTGESKSIAFTNIKYSVGYYKITDMLVYKLKQTTIYDADSTEVKTVGDDLFSDWNNNKIILNPNNIELPVELIGINGKINNTKANINNRVNYVKVYLKDKYGNKSDNINSNGNITMSYKNDFKISANDYKVIFSQKDNAKIAETLGLKVVVEVQNMTLKINGEIVNSSNDKVVKEFDLADYLNSNETMQVTTSRPNFKKDMYNSIGNITANDYSNSNKINTNILNGIRTIAGKVEYEAVIVIGDKDQTKVTDTVYYSDENTDTQTVVFEAQKGSITKVYEINNKATNNVDKYKDVEMLNVYTPITVTSSFKSENNVIVDQTKDVDINTNAIQINTPFTITLDNAQRVDMYNINSTRKYNGGYYIKFDFDVHQIKINGVLHQDGKKISANTWIGPIYRNKKDKATITAQAYGDLKNSNTVSEENKSYTIRAVAQNITDLMRTLSLDYASIEDMLTYNTTLKDFMNNICDVSSYFSETKEEVVIINRLYDFRVTDLKDLSWKNVFRKSSGNTTNLHTGNLYYSGTTKWNSNSEKINEIISRTSSEIGRNPLRILPLGPYKNSDTTYIKAPKLGYRFSFDMKVTGTYSTNKKVGIKTKFYYISKDGKTYIGEYNGKNEGIYLFYKNSSGKYVRIDETNGGGYNLTFIPNDGYRYIEDTDKSKLATSTVSLGNLRSITLNYKMATTSTGEAYVTYYGEYKLPNSTIAVKVNKDGTYDINKPLTDGYIGVVFDITAYTGTILTNEKTQSVNLSYSKDTNGTNTSQWDYEGFLGYTKYGNKVTNNTLSIKLEKGKWNINNDIYNKIKGSVILYDVDQRAATDYE